MKVAHTTTYKLYQPKIKKSFKIVVISDLHFSDTVSNEKLQAILKHVQELQPNYILFPAI